MRNLYLVRHGRVDFPEGIRRCIGRTDLMLDETGRRQAKKLAAYFDQITAVFCSPLIRAAETAELLSAGRWPVKSVVDLQELDMGEWENIPLYKIKKTLESEPQQGESRTKGLDRFQRSIKQLLEKTEGDIICVAHAGINCCFLADLLGIPLERSRGLPQPYGGFSRIKVWESENKKEGIMQEGMVTMHVAELGLMPQKTPDDRECVEIWNRYHTPEDVRLHCKAVCKRAEKIGRQLIKAGQSVDMVLIHSAALLHDVAKGKTNHEKEGAKWIRQKGYPVLADIIRQHHDLKSWDSLEAVIVYLADKYTMNDQPVTLAERFARSREKCLNNPDALTAHELRYCQAIEAAYKIQSLTGKIE